MEKNQKLIGTAEGYTYDGDGVVKAEGMVFFVPGLLEGEEAELSITAMKKNFGFARIVKLIKPSEHRVVPQCSVYRLCGGCQLLHMDHEEQMRFKEDKVRGCFLQNAHMEIEPKPILSADEQDHYRSKVQVPVQVNNGNVEMGFYQNHTNRIIPYDECLVQTDLSNRIVASFKLWTAKLNCAEVFRHVLIKHAEHTNQAMVCMIVRQYPFHGAERLVTLIKDTYPEVKSILCVINRRSDNVILDGQEVQLYGTPYIEDELLGCTFRISARSFYQINPFATELLYQKAIEKAGLSGKEVLIDLYCGTGTIGILASKHAKKVYGIEIVDDAIKDARVNAELNHCTNIDFFTADAEAGAARLVRSKIKPDVVIVDPPRKGCSKNTLNAIAVMSPKRLVYVSCDPATLARDCAYMKEQGYEINEVQPVDMFPQTTHVETVVLLSRNSK